MVGKDPEGGAYVVSYLIVLEAHGFKPSFEKVEAAALVNKHLSKFIAFNKL